MIDKGSAFQRFDGQKELPCIVISAGARGPLHGNGRLTQPLAIATLLVRNKVIASEGILPSRSEQDRVPRPDIT